MDKGRKDLGPIELIAIALGGMVGGGIFAILGVSVEMVGNATPIAILIGGILAFFAARSYVKLALLYKDEGATYSFFKKSFPKSPLAASIIGWLITFGYISTLALYAFTFSSYFCSMFSGINSPLFQKLMAGAIIVFFAIINILSVRGMGRLEDWLVYTKVIILVIISGFFVSKGDIQNILPIYESSSSISSILIVSAVTFVAYEGFQLVIHAYNEMESPQKNIPIAIYSAIAIAILIYIGLAVAAMSAIPKAELIAGKEYALASGAKQYLGDFGYVLVILGALLATSSAINGTLFGASRLMAVIATDGYLPKPLKRRIKVHIPITSIIVMCVLSFALILSGGLQLILEFGSITFILISFLMAFANFKMRKKTHTGGIIAMIAMVALFIGGVMIFYFEYQENFGQLVYILTIYLILSICALVYALRKKFNKS